ARRQLEEQRRTLQEQLGEVAPRQLGPGEDVEALRRRQAELQDAISFGEGTGLEPSSAAAMERFRDALSATEERDASGRRLTPAERRARATDRLRLEQDRLTRELGGNDAGEQAQREAFAQTGADEDDSFAQRMAKA